MNKTILNNNDFSIIFKKLDDIKKTNDYTATLNTMKSIEELDDPIEKLKKYVLDNEFYNYNIITTT